ncbi:hypothetical protein ACHQM5_029662 [Ranunculus cassubicifolius]
MADPYRRYLIGSERGLLGSVPESGLSEGVPRTSFPGYVNSETSFLAAHHLRGANELRNPPLDYLQKEILPQRVGAYGIEDFSGITSLSAPGLSGLVPGAPLKGFANPDVTQGMSRGIPDIINERPSSLRKVDVVLPEESSILFVDGLPSDCTRREVSHLFRPFIGFKEIKLVHKEPRHSRDKATVLCFVEFTDSKCALTAMEALQGYQFDVKKVDAPSLKIQFAQFPFRPPSSRDE